MFIYEVFLSKPDPLGVLTGLVPQMKILKNHSMLYLSLGIVGATVMPHDLYLGSSISQTRKVDRKNDNEIAKALKFSTIDSNIQLIITFIVNCLLLILGAELSMVKTVI